jgi:hypothetical protein
MELLDRYLKTVRTYLPATQKDDIIRELSENIRSQIEDKEAELGRPLQEAEIEAILKAHGHPLIVAGRYRQDERSFSFGKQLIGPVLFPFYAKVLAFNLGITSIVIIFLFTLLVVSGQPVGRIAGLPGVLLFQLAIQFAIITAVFVGVDRQLARHPDRWDPQKSARTFYPHVADEAGKQRVSRIDSFSRLIALAVSVVWLRAVQQNPFLILGPAAAFLKLAPVWHELYVPVVLLAFAGMAQAAINLIRPDWIHVRTVTRIGMGIAAVAIWCFLLKAGNWIVPGNASTNGAAVSAQTLEIINRSFFYSLLVAVVISVVQLLHVLFRLVRETHHRAPSQAI